MITALLRARTTLGTSAGRWLVAPLAAVMVFVTMVGAASPATAGPTDDTIVWDSYTWTRTGGGTGGHQGVYRKANVRVGTDNVLSIRAMRHCSSVPLTETTPVHSAPCATPSNTKYSIGRLNLFGAVPQGQDFSLTFVAKMPQQYAKGARGALWANNTGGGVGYCGTATSPLGEIDVLEWYSKQPTETTETTHAGCVTDSTGKALIPNVSYKGTQFFNPAAYNTFTADKVGSTVTYRVNGSTVATHRCGVDVVPNTSSCAEIMNRPWNAFIQTEVFTPPAGTSKFDGPAPELSFPTQEMLVKDVSISIIPKPAVGTSWTLSNSFGGFGDRSLQYGITGDVPVVGDWDGNRTATPGVFRNGWWYLSNDFTGATHRSFPFGNPGDRPVVGDWDGNGTVTPGVFRDGWFYLSNDFSGTTHVSAPFGIPSDVPVAGDWDGNGTTTVGVFRGSHYYLSNTYGGATHISIPFGVDGDRPIVGDWDGNGTDTIGVFRGSAWYLSNAFNGITHLAFNYGDPSDTPLVGDYDGNGSWTPGILR